jgi:2-amino-4-hydroxy-6-hydroxymethyldihydropteridine diphosphokinase
MVIVTAYLGLGSNLGDREGNLRRVLSLLGQKMVLKDISSIYETEPWGYALQPTFFNMVCAVETGLSPQELLKVTQEIERDLGRAPTFQYGPRIMDVDILLYGGYVIDTPELQIPHTYLWERAFVLVPMAEIAPGLTHPSLGKSVMELLAQVSEKEKVVILGRMSA